MIDFDSPLPLLLEHLPRDQHEAPFGVIGLDSEHRVVAYNTWESSMAGLSPERVIGRPMFTDVAPCMNNFMVAQRFAEGVDLDETIDYVLTLRMRPTKVQLRLIARPAADVRWILVRRH